MVGSQNRRGFLRVLAGGIGGGTVVAGTTAGAVERNAEFDPVEHGFGFRNWSTATMPFEPPPVQEPTRPETRDRVSSGWRSPAARFLDLDFGAVPSALVNAIATQAWVALVQRSGTNGHCYGIALAAQNYYEQPEQIPLDRERSSEFLDPTEPIEDPREAPVYQDVVRLQASQFLQFRAWLGRRLMLFPNRIDYERQVDALQAMLDRYGTASISVFDGPTSGHQVLAYNVEDVNREVEISVYDPNDRAERYANRRRSVRLEHAGDGLTMQPYADRYDEFVFNRFDRVAAVTDQESPLAFTDIDPETVVDSLFPMLVVTVDDPDVTVNVTGPNGRGARRLTSRFMDRTRGAIPRIRSRYGAESGTYQIGVVGQRDTEYELTAIAATPENRLLNQSVTGTIDAGEVRTYEATVSDGSESGTLDRTNPGQSWRPTALGIAGGAALGAGAYRYYQNRNRRK